MFTNSLRRGAKKLITPPTTTLITIPKRTFLQQRKIHPRDRHAEIESTSFWADTVRTWKVSQEAKREFVRNQSYTVLSHHLASEGPVTRSCIPKNAADIALHYGSKPLSGGGPLSSALAAAATGRTLIRDLGLALHCYWPWYLHRTSNRPKNPVHKSIWACAVSLSRNASAARVRFWFMLLLLSFSWDAYNLKNAQHNPVENAIICNSAMVITEYMNANKHKVFDPSSIASFTNAYKLVKAREFAKSCQNDKKNAILNLTLQSSHQNISALLFAFYRLPVTETIRAQLDINVDKMAPRPIKKLRNSEPQLSTFKDFGKYTIADLIKSNSSTPLVSTVASTLNNMDDTTYLQSLLVEMTALAALRNGYETLINNYNSTLYANTTYQVPQNISNYRYVQSHMYQPILDSTPGSSIKDAAILDAIGTIFQSTPIAHLTSIKSPDVGLALSLGVKYPAAALPYASILLNAKSILQEQLHDQHAVPSKPDSPTPSTLLATQQLIPQDLLQLYPIILGDNKSTPLNQSLLLIDLSIGQLLHEYYRVSNTGPPAPSIYAPVQPAQAGQSTPQQYQTQLSTAAQQYPQYQHQYQQQQQQQQQYQQPVINSMVPINPNGTTGVDNGTMNGQQQHYLPPPQALPQYQQQPQPQQQHYLPPPQALPQYQPQSQQLPPYQPQQQQLPPYQPQQQQQQQQQSNTGGYVNTGGYMNPYVPYQYQTNTPNNTTTTTDNNVSANAQQTSPHVAAQLSHVNDNNGTKQ